MAKGPETQPEKIETAVRDFLSVFPEETREAYDYLLRRCNFHDIDDPLYPIMLFLLFFQESVSENAKQVEESIADLKASYSKNEKEIRRIRKPISLYHYALLVLTILNLLVFSLGSVKRSSSEPVQPNPEETVEETPRNELRAIHRYWTRKLAEKTDILPYRMDYMIVILAVAGAIAAWIPVLFSIRKRIHVRFPVRAKRYLPRLRPDKAVENKPEQKE